MKRYVPIIIGIVALCAVLYLGNSQMNKDKDITKDEQGSSTVMDKNFKDQKSLSNRPSGQ